MEENKEGFRVLLLTPPRGLWKDEVERPGNTTQPLGIAYVAASVRAGGFPVKVIDAYSQGMPGPELREQIESYKPRVVGISALTPQWPDARKVTDIVKDIDRDIVTVVGGVHVSALPEEVTGYPNVDIAVIGEGEDTMLEICEAMARGADFRNVDGLAYRKDGSMRKTLQRSINNDLDRLPFPAHDILPEPSFYNPFPSWGLKGNFSSIISGRGCPYNCTFCDVTAQQGKKYRLRSAGNVVEEMVWLSREFGVTTFSFRDPSMFCNRRRLVELCRLIDEKGLKVAWTCNGRANEVNPEILAKMKQAGCRLIQFGIEVGNEEMLQSIKRVSREKVINAVRETRKAGIEAHGYFMFGFIQETPETIEETIAFAKELDLDSAGFAVMVPFPGTQEFEQYKKEGLLLTEDWRDYDIMGKPVYRHKFVTSEQLASAPRRAYRQFYLRPRIIARHMRKITSPQVLRSYINSAKAVLR